MLRQRGSARALAIIFAVFVGFALANARPASATFSLTPDPTWMTNGIVYAIAQSGNTIYIGGRFTSVRACPVGTTCTGNVVGVNNVAAFDATTGEAIRSFRPAVTGGSPTSGGGTTLPTVYGLAVMGGKLFIGGSFTTVAGQPRLNFAAVDAVTGALDPNVNKAVGADANTYVRTVLANSSRVYIGGNFTTVGGVARQRLAALDVNGTLDTVWKPRTSTWVKALSFSCDGSKVIAGGNFRSAAGSGQTIQSRVTVARFDAVTGAMDAWRTPDGAIPNGVNAFDLAPTCERLFVAYGGSNRIFALDLTDDVADVLWTRQTGGDVQTVAVYNDLVLMGGHFSQVKDSASGEGAKRIRFAAIDHDGVNLDPWAPEFDGSFFGPWDILVRGNQVWVGGAFKTVSGIGQSNIARFTDVP